MYMSNEPYYGPTGGGKGGGAVQPAYSPSNRPSNAMPAGTNPYGTMDLNSSSSLPQVSTQGTTDPQSQQNMGIPSQGGAPMPYMENMPIYGGPATPPPAQTPSQQPQPANLPAQPDFNQLAAQSMRGAMGATQMGMQGSAQGMNFYSPMYAGAYMNPYQQNVIGGLRQEAGRNYDMMSNQIGAEASRAGAFGGSRHGVAQGTAAGDIQRGLNQQIGQLQYQGYGDALNRAAQDQQMRMGASSQLTGQAQGLSGIGRNMYDMSRQANLDMQQSGLQQQAIQQAIIDAAKGQYAGFTGAPAAALSYLGQALGGSAGMVPQSTTDTKQPGLFDYLTLGAMARGK